MWILPKQIQSLTSVSVLDTKESEEDLEQFCQMSEKSLMWRSKPSLLRTWLTRWKRNSWMQHLSTRTLKPSHTESFEDKWTSLVEDSLVSPSHKLGLEKLLKTQDTSSLTSQKESESANQELFSSKMSKESSVAKPTKENQFSNMSSEHWKAWVTEQRREYSQRVKSASLIRENESTFVGYPTPSVAGCVEGGVANNVQMDEKGIFYRYNKKGVKWSVKLRDAVIHQASKNWATPQAFDSVDLVRTQEKIEQTRKEKNAGCMNLREQVHYPEMDHKRKTWGTPNARDWKGPSGRAMKGVCKDLPSQTENFPTPQASDEEKYRLTGNSQASKCLSALARKGELTDSQQDQTNLNTSGKPQGSLKLNPDWVEQLMGLPIGWTDFDSSEME